MEVTANATKTVTVQLNLTLNEDEARTLSCMMFMIRNEALREDFMFLAENIEAVLDEKLADI